MKTKDNIDNVISVFLLIGLVLSVSGMSLSTYMYFNGDHNTDLGQNIRYLNAKYDLGVIDYASEESEIKVLTGKELYITRMGQMKQAFFLMALFTFFFAVILSSIAFKLFGKSR